MRLQRLFKISSSFILCVILFLPCVVSAGPLDNWHQRNTSPSNTLYAVTYGDGNFIAVGVPTAPTSLVLTSPDSINWTEREGSPNLETMTGAAYGNDTFLVADYYGRFMTSPDGISWTYRYQPYAERIERLYGLSYGNDIFVAVGGKDFNGAIQTSTDGINWAQVNSDTQEPLTVQDLYSVVYGNGQFVTVGVSGTVLTSPDGTTWTERTRNY